MNQTSVVYGFGFEVTDVEEATLIDFIKNHETAALKNKLLLPDNDEVVYPETQCTVTGTEGENACIQNIMQDETGIDFEFHIIPDTQQEFILLPELMPWLYNDTEKALTEKSLTEILNRYITELEISASPDNIRIEY